MKKIIATALVSILLIGSLASCSENAITLKGERQCYIAEIDGFDKSDAKYLIDHPSAPLPASIEISEDMTVEVVNGVPQVSGSITNISDKDIASLYINFEVFTEDQVNSPETIFAGASIMWQLNTIDNGPLVAGATTEFQTYVDPNAPAGMAYIALDNVSAG